MKRAMVLTAVALVLSFAIAPRAEAASLPFVDDVNDWGAGRVIVTVTCCGDSSAKLRVIDTKTNKSVKVKKHHKRVWTVVMKRDRFYKLSVRDRGYKWKSIGYRVF